MIVTKLPFSVRSPGCGSCSETMPTSTSAFGSRWTSSLRPAARIFWTASCSSTPLTSGTATGFAAAELILQRLIGEPAADERACDQQHGEKPRPDRSLARRFVVLVVPARRVGRARDRRGPDRRRRLADVRLRENRRRRLGGLGGDADPTRDPLEVGVHLLGRVVPVGGILREGSQDDVVEVARDLRPVGRRRRRAPARGASSRSRPASHR